MFGLSHRRWRPGPDTAIALAALVLAGGGISWAVTQGGQQINACAEPASGPNGPVLRYNPSGGPCQSGETALSWNQQGPQGPPGQSAREPVVSVLPVGIYDRFTVKTTITTPGLYSVDGLVTLLWRKPFTRTYKKRAVTCGLQGSGPTAYNSQSFLFKKGIGFVPSSFNGPLDVSQVMTITATPQTISFGCGASGPRRRTEFEFFNPTITARPESIQPIVRTKPQPRLIEQRAPSAATP